MATGSILLSPGAATLPDGSTSNVPPALQVKKSSASAPGAYYLQLSYDPSTEQWVTFAFRVPADYASSPVAKIQYKMSAGTTGAVVWDVRFGFAAAASSVDLNAKGFGSANTTTSAVPGTVGFMAEASVTVTNADSCAAGGFLVVRVARAAADASDTATGNAELVAVTVEYTTT